MHIAGTSPAGTCKGNSRTAGLQAHTDLLFRASTWLSQMLVSRQTCHLLQQAGPGQQNAAMCLICTHEHASALTLLLITLCCLCRLWCLHCCLDSGHGVLVGLLPASASHH